MVSWSSFWCCNCYHHKMIKPGSNVCSSVWNIASIHRTRFYYLTLAALSATNVCVDDKTIFNSVVSKEKKSWKYTFIFCLSFFPAFLVYTECPVCWTYTWLRVETLAISESSGLGVCKLLRHLHLNIVILFLKCSCSSFPKQFLNFELTGI